MKKAIVFFLLVTTVLIFTGCGGQPEAPASSESPESSETTSPSPSQQTEQNSDKATREQFIAAVDPFLKKQGYPELAAFDPYKEEMSDGTIAYGYDVAEGVSIYFYEHPDTEKLTSIFFSANTDGISEDSLYFYGYLTAVAIKAFEPNLAEAVDASLDMDNISTDAVKTATGENADYVYAVDGSLLMFSILVTI